MPGKEDFDFYIGIQNLYSKIPMENIIHDVCTPIPISRCVEAFISFNENHNRVDLISNELDDLSFYICNGMPLNLLIERLDVIRNVIYNYWEDVFVLMRIPYNVNVHNNILSNVLTNFKNRIELLGNDYDKEQFNIQFIYDIPTLIENTLNIQLNLMQKLMGVMGITNLINKIIDCFVDLHNTANMMYNLMRA